MPWSALGSLSRVDFHGFKRTLPHKAPRQRRVKQAFHAAWHHDCSLLDFYLRITS